MNYLVDTNVFSESTKPRSDAGVAAWLRAHEHEFYLSTITLGEIRRGIERLAGGDRQTALRAWLHSLGERMKGRILGFNASTAHVWGQLKAEWERKGISVASLDSQVAATAKRYKMTLVTRNVEDFRLTGISIFTPFQG